MGYATEFEGKFTITPPLQPAHRDYLNFFASTRRMKRNETLASQLPDPKRQAVVLPIGKDASYFVGGAGFLGQDEDKSILDYNTPPQDQPGLWCQWKASDDGNHLAWDETEKFYCYTEWLKYLVEHFLGPWDYKLNGIVNYRGENMHDLGHIRAVDGIINQVEGELK